MERKGQSALEYLMTYGWALIVIAIVIGVLVFIMSTTTSGSNCTSDNTQIIYVDHAVDSSGALDLRVQNGAGQSVIISDLNVGGDWTGSTSEPTLPKTVTTGNEVTIKSTDVGITSGGTYRGTVDITYKRGSSTGVEHNATITCTGTAA